MSDAPFTLIRNPYIVGNPVEDSRMFFGRDDDFSYIRARVGGSDTGGMIVLCGTRRSGKTSILFQILQGRLGPEYLPVLVDLQSMTAQGDSAFVTALAESIEKAIRNRVPNLTFTPISPDFGDVAYAFRLLCKHARERLGGVSLVVMFDEYELFESWIDAEIITTRVLDLLGDTIRHDAGIFMLFTGSEKLEARNAAYWISSLGKSLHRRISFLSEADAVRLICEPVQQLVKYAPGVPQRILRLGAGQPFYTQVICQALVDHLNDQHKNEVSDADLDAVVQEIIDNPLPHMVFSWGGLSGVQKVALAVLGELNRDEERFVHGKDVLTFLRNEKSGITLAEDKLNEALERLFQEDLLEKSEDGTSFGFKMDLWRLWIGRMHSIWQALDEIQQKGHGSELGVIHLGRRRLRRLGTGAAVLIVGLAFAYLFTRPDERPVGSIAVPDTTLVSVRSDPEGASVFVDNYLIGRAPLDSVRVQVGRFAVRLEMAGFHANVDTVTFLADSLNVHAAALRELTGTILVDSRPRGAVVEIDGVTLNGPTPVRAGSLSVRRLHDVILQLPGNLPGTYRNVQVLADSVVTLLHDFDRPTFPLTVTTVPPGATIRLDGQDLGRAPVTLAAVPSGEHEIECQMEGYFGIQRHIEIPSPANRLDLTLAALPPGVIVLRVQPYADIMIDDKLVASSTVAYRLAVSQGMHKVEFRHPHLGAYKQDVNVVSEDTVVVQYRFEGADR